MLRRVMRREEVHVEDLSPVAKILRSPGLDSIT
jgi:hypothetical protein